MSSLVVLAVVAAAALSILWYHAKTGVPPVPSTSGEIETIVALLAEAGLPHQARIYELGCGWGSLALGLARAFPEATIVGYEISPLPSWIAKLRTRNDARIRIVRGDYRRAALADADAVTAYLMIAPMKGLATLLDQQLRRGTPVVTLCFGFRDRTAAASRPLGGLAGEAQLYRWPADHT